MAAASTSGNTVPVEEWLSFVTKYYDKTIREYTTLSVERRDLTKSTISRDTLVIFPNNKDVNTFNGGIFSKTGTLTNFTLTYRENQLTFTPEHTTGVSVTIQSLMTVLNIFGGFTKPQRGGARRRSRKAKKNKALSPK